MILKILGWLKALSFRILGFRPWSMTWQKELTQALSESQKGLSVNMVVVIARESDLYSEILFLFSFLGVSIGSLVAFFLRSYVAWSEDLIVIPLAGFALGSTLYTFRRFYLSKVAPRAVRDRVTEKAKSQFYDHLRQLKGRLAMLYFSELEKEALLLSTPDISDLVPPKEVQQTLSMLVRTYDTNDPLKALRPALIELGNILREHIKTNRGSGESQLLSEAQRGPIFIKASDRKSLLVDGVHILKGNKDIN